MDTLSPVRRMKTSPGLAGERAAQGRGYLDGAARLHDDDRHRALNRQLLRAVEDLVVVADGGAAEPADGEEQMVRRVEFENALELALDVDAREVVGALAQIQRTAQGSQQLAL